MTIQKELIAYISKISKISTAELAVDTCIYNSGVISSLALLEFMAHIERTYGLFIAPEELIEDNFKDVNTIALFIQSKREKDMATGQSHREYV